MIFTSMGKCWQRPARHCLALLPFIPVESRQEIQALDLLKSALKCLRGLVWFCQNILPGRRASIAEVGPSLSVPAEAIPGDARGFMACFRASIHQFKEPAVTADAAAMNYRGRSSPRGFNGDGRELHPGNDKCSQTR